MSFSASSKVFPGVAPGAKEFVASHGVVALAPSIDKVWVALSNGGIEVRNAYSGEIVHFFEPPKRSTNALRPWCLLAVSGSDGEKMWVGLSNGTIEVLSCADFSTIFQLKKHVSGVYCMSSNRDSVFAGSSDFTITQWKKENGQLLRVYNGHTNYVRSLYAEGTSVFSGSDDQTIRMWDVMTGECKKVVKSPSHLEGGVLVLCRIGVTLWSGDSSGCLVRRSLDLDTLISCQQLHTNRIISIELVGSRVYVSCGDGSAFVLVANSGELVNRFALGPSRIASVRCTAELARYYHWTGAGDNTVRCWHHDEENTMTTDRQRFKDMLQFYSAVQPYREKNEEMIQQLLNLREICVLAEGGEKAIKEAMMNKQMELQTKAAKSLILATKINYVSKENVLYEDELQKIQKARHEKERALEVLREKLHSLNTAVQTLKMVNQNVGEPDVPKEGYSISPVQLL